jgi:hypothetical protein
MFDAWRESRSWNTVGHGEFKEKSVDYFQGVVSEYLRSHRDTFINTEYLIQLDEGAMDAKDRHWYCDAIALNLRMHTVDLCEISYSKTLHSLLRRLQVWSNNWPLVTAAIARESHLPKALDWIFQPHIFVHCECRQSLQKNLNTIIRPEGQSVQRPDPQITWLDDVLPWTYRPWDGTRYQENIEIKHHSE